MLDVSIIDGPLFWTDCRSSPKVTSWGALVEAIELIDSSLVSGWLLMISNGIVPTLRSSMIWEKSWIGNGIDDVSINGIGAAATTSTVPLSFTFKKFASLFVTWHSVMMTLIVILNSLPGILPVSSSSPSINSSHCSSCLLEDTLGVIGGDKVKQLWTNAEQNMKNIKFIWSALYEMVISLQSLINRIKPNRPWIQSWKSFPKLLSPLLFYKMTRRPNIWTWEQIDSCKHFVASRFWNLDYPDEKMFRQLIWTLRMWIHVKHCMFDQHTIIAARIMYHLIHFYVCSIINHVKH